MMITEGNKRDRKHERPTKNKLGREKDSSQAEYKADDFHFIE